jgi:hypothetical protein
VPVAPVSGLTRAEAHKLQAALQELAECRRLIEAAFKDEAA